jgi:hypothetical protein
MLLASAPPHYPNAASSQNTPSSQQSLSQGSLTRYFFERFSNVYSLVSHHTDMQASASETHLDTLSYAERKIPVQILVEPTTMSLSQSFIAHAVVMHMLMLMFTFIFIFGIHISTSPLLLYLPQSSIVLHVYTLLLSKTIITADRHHFAVADLQTNPKTLTAVLQPDHVQKLVLQEAQQVSQLQGLRSCASG